MMRKDSTTSQLDLLLLEEVSNETAEAISGGASLTLGGSQELELGDPFTMPIDVLTNLVSSVGALTAMLGIEMPAFPVTKLPEIPAPPTPELPRYS
ncbi:MAG: hypothetical protein QNJ72_26325 [Pleurocapsa sp. MO_226.B13]|nr:hypothetical protein [Pleurocapsa sp. MO_226.B13]